MQKAQKAQSKQHLKHAQLLLLLQQQQQTSMQVVHFYNLLRNQARWAQWYHKVLRPRMGQLIPGACVVVASNSFGLTIQAPPLWLRPPQPGQQAEQGAPSWNLVDLVQKHGQGERREECLEVIADAMVSSRPPGQLVAG
jgi:hypothetical protein